MNNISFYLRTILKNNSNFFNNNYHYNVFVMSPDGLLDEYYQNINLAKTKELISKNHNVEVVNLTLGMKLHMIDGRKV